jgi:hypothetical protein
VGSEGGGGGSVVRDGGGGVRPEGIERIGIGMGEGGWGVWR